MDTNLSPLACLQTLFSPDVVRLGAQKGARSGSGAKAWVSVRRVRLRPRGGKAATAGEKMGCRVWKKVLLGLMALAAAGVAVVLFLIGPRNLLGMLRYDQRREGDLAVGHAAPDVALVGLDGRARTLLSKQPAGRPLVLVFGSYT